MKRMFTIMAAIMITAVAAAQQFNSVLNFRLQNNQAFALSVNGVQVGNLSPRATVDNLRPGKHRISVAIPVYNHIGYRSMQTIYNGWVNVGANKVVYASLDRYNNFVVEQTIALNHNRGRWNKQPQYQYDQWNSPVVEDCNIPPVAVQPVQPIIDAVTFQQLKETINRTGFESTRQSILNQSMSHYWFTTHQVREVLGLFNFESTRLDVAKRMYDRTVDKQNYFIVSDAFHFSSSVEDLNQYLAMR